MVNIANPWSSLYETPGTVSLVSDPDALRSVYNSRSDDSIYESNDTIVTTDYDVDISELSLQTGQEGEGIESSTSLYDILLPSDVAPIKENRLFKYGCVTVLNDCMHQLSILSSTYRKSVENLNRREVGYASAEERFGKFGVDYNAFVLNSVYTDAHKFQKDLKTLIFVVKEVSDEMYIFGAGATLTRYLDNQMRMEDEETKVIEDYKKNVEYYEHFKIMYADEHVQKQKDFQDMDRLKGELLGVLKDEMELVRAEVSLTKRWEHARFEQNSMVLQLNEGKFRSTIADLEKKMKLEDRCHQLMEEYLVESKEDYSAEIEFWMDTYDREIETRDNEIYKIKVDTERLQDKVIALRETVDRREEEMEEWIEYKRLKKEEEERFQLETEAATRIQAWWRGVMYRKKLGPYRKKKKGKKGKKGKQNKKKNRK